MAKNATKSKSVAVQERGIVSFTEFKTRDFIAEKKNPLSMDRIVVDNRFFTQFSQELLRDTVNAEIVAQKLLNNELYTKMVTLLTNRTGEKIIETIFPVPVVNMDVPAVETRKLMDACYAATNDIDAALVMAEFMRHCLAPYGVLNPVEEKSVVVSPHMTMLPTEDDILVDILKREIEGALKTIGVPYRGSERKMGTSVVATIVCNTLSDVGRSLLYLGEYGSIVKDVFRLIRASIDFTQDYKGIPKDLVRHPHVSAMARNLTLARIACGKEYNNLEATLNTATYELRERITQIYNFVTSSQRYSDISLNDFASRFTKTVTVDSKGKKKVMTIAMNLIGAPCAQVVHFTQNSIGLIDSGKFFELPDASAQITSSYGSILSHCSTYESASLLDAVMSNYVQINELQKPVYSCIGFPDLLEDGAHDTVGHALAIAKCSPSIPPFVSVSAEDGLQFAYEIKLDGVDYAPVSGGRLANGALLTDPFEFLLLVDDWRGEKALTDRQQVLPKPALDRDHIVINPKSIESEAFNRRHRISIQINSDTYDALLVPNVVFGVRDTEAIVITPILNRSVMATHLFAVQDAISIANGVKDQAQRVAVKAIIFEHVLGMVKALEPHVIERVAEQIRMQIIANAKDSEGNSLSSYHMEGKLSLKMYRRLIELHAADFILRRYAVYEDASGAEGPAGSITSALRAVVEDVDFATYLGIAAIGRD